MEACHLDGFLFCVSIRMITHDGQVRHRGGDTTARVHVVDHGGWEREVLAKTFNHKRLHVADPQELDCLELEAALQTRKKSFGKQTLIYPQLSV